MSKFLMAKPKRSARMQLLTRLAAQELEACLQQLGQAQQQLQHEQEQLQNLIDYQADYQQRGRQSLISSQGGLGMNSYMQFLNQLAQAIKQQQQKVDFCEQTCQQLQKNWLKLDNKQKNFAQLSQQYLTTESQIIEKKLQAEIDDLSARRLSYD